MALNFREMPRINRYIVGCKYSYRSLLVLPVYRINRYIVGCKLNGMNISDNITAELIDT